MSKGSLYIAGFFVGIGVGQIVSINRIKPEAAYVRDLNSDGIPDVIIKQTGSKYVFLGQKDGTYKSLETIKAESLANEKDKQSVMQKSIEEQIKVIEETAKEIK